MECERLVNIDNFARVERRHDVDDDDDDAYKHTTYQNLYF